MLNSSTVLSGSNDNEVRTGQPLAEHQWPDDTSMPFKSLQQTEATSSDDEADAQSVGGESVGQMSSVSDIQQQAEAMNAMAKSTLVDRIKRYASRHGLRARTVNVDWPDDDLEDEMRRLENEVAVARSLKFQRRMLLTFTAGCEYVHHKTPLSGRLDGWGESVLAQIDDYDDVFERLHEKHAPKLGVAGVGKAEEPEIQLLRMLAYSAFTHAVTTSIAKMSLAPGSIEQRKEQAAVRMRESASDSHTFINATTKGGSTKRTVKLS